MKTQRNEFPVPSKTKRTPADFLLAVFAGLIGSFTFGAHAAVQVTRFDPPVQISAYTDPAGDSVVNVFAADLDANGVVDFNLGYGLGYMGAYFNAPVRFGARVTQPNAEGGFGPVAGVALGAIIGSNIVSPDALNFYGWSSGYTNRDDLTRPLGDHESTVIIANLVAYNQGEPIVTITTNGFVTNIVSPFPVVTGDVVGKNAAVALEFYIDGQPHYGYIHFNFNAGAGGVIYGWAYETESNTPIRAVSLAAPTPSIDTAQIHSGILGMVKQGDWAGCSVSIWSAGGTFVKGVQTDDDGYFKVDLAPGRYLLRPTRGSGAEPVLATTNNSLNGVAKSAIVRRNHFTFVTLPRSGSGSDSPQH